MMLKLIWHKLKRLLPHLSIILAGMFLVLYVADMCNPNMKFVGSSIARPFLLVFCLSTIVTEILLIRIYRKHK